MKYKIVEASSAQELEEKVKGSIEAGFSPIGGVSVTSCTVDNQRTGDTDFSEYFYQAMVIDC